MTHVLNIDPNPFAWGGYGDVFKGTLDGSRVCIKRIRVYTDDDPKKAAKVRRLTLLLPPSSSIDKVRRSFAKRP